jgi:hypothetical protein
VVLRLRGRRQGQEGPRAAGGAPRGHRHPQADCASKGHPLREPRHHPLWRPFSLRLLLHQPLQRRGDGRVQGASAKQRHPHILRRLHRPLGLRNNRLQIHDDCHRSVLQNSRLHLHLGCAF